MKLLILIKYIVLGIIQGITEPLPISSSGHIFILKRQFNNIYMNDLNLEIIINFASCLAVLIIYKKDILNLITSVYKYIFKKEKIYKKDYKYFLCIIISIIPISIIGLLLKDYIELKLNNIKIIGISFIITSLMLFIIKNKKCNKNIYDISFKDAIVIGIFNIISLIPGISRSGTTYVSSTLSNIEKNSTLNYSFMMYIPISVASFILGLKDFFSSYNNSLLIPYLISFIFAFVTSLFTLKWLINKFNNRKLIYFSIYTFIIGSLILFFM